MAEDKNTPRMGTSWLIAGGFLLLLVIGVIVTLIVFPGDDENEPDAATETTETELPTDDETTADSENSTELEACELDEADPDFPASAPEFSWEDHPSGVVLPVSDEHGPAVREDNLWRCTSQTPSGAALAGPSLYTAFHEGEQAAAEDSPRARELFGQSEALDQPTDVVVRGFRITSSNEDAATIDYWMESSVEDSAVLSVELFLVWDEQANDWRLDFSDGEPNYTPIEDTTVYTEWR